MKKLWDSFQDAVAEIAYIIAPFIRSKKEPICNIAQKIAIFEEKEHPAIDFILAYPGMKKTPLYFLHRKEMPEKYHVRKQNFLALVEYVRAKKEEEKETIIRCYRDVCRNPDTGNAYHGINLYFVGTPSRLDEIEGDMELVRSIFRVAVEKWTPYLKYEESSISECDAWDAYHSADLAQAEKGGSAFVFEVSDEMDGEWDYWGWYHDREWYDIHLYVDFPLAALNRVLARMEL